MNSEESRNRTAEFSRETNETEARVKINLDGKGKSEIDTGIGFFNHLLENFAVFALFDLTIQVKGDLEVNSHHTIEDSGIALGKALRKALGNGEKIARLGFCFVPLDETLVRVCLDISGRPYLDFTSPKKLAFEAVDFLRGFVNHSLITLSVEVTKGENEHHICEAIFKGLGYSLRQALAIEPRIEGVLSAK